MENKLRQDCGKMVIKLRDLMTDNSAIYTTPIWTATFGVSFLYY